MSAHVLLNLLNELGKSVKMRGLRFFATSVINSIIVSGLRMLDFINHVTHFWRENVRVLPYIHDVVKSIIS